MLEELLMPILQEEGPKEMLFQQDGAPLHFLSEVRVFLDERFLVK
jgi:hypothetical protein